MTNSQDLRKMIDKLNQKAEKEGRILDPSRSLQPPVTQIIFFRKIPKYLSRKP